MLDPCRTASKRKNATSSSTERASSEREACHCWTALLTANRAAVTPWRRELGLTLPAAGTPKANYTIACWESPTRLYLSGHLPIK